MTSKKRLIELISELKKEKEVELKELVLANKLHPTIMQRRMREFDDLLKIVGENRINKPQSKTQNLFSNG